MLKYTFTILWFVLMTFDLLFYVYLWQLKEYRLDRLLDHLKVGKGRKSLFNAANYLKLLSLGLLILLYFWSTYELVGLSLVFGLYLYLTTKKVFKVIFHGLTRPVWTMKAILITVISSGILVGLAGYIWWQVSVIEHLMLWLCLLQVLTFEVVTAVVYGFKPITTTLKQSVIGRAASRLRENKNLIVVGITGSFGKSSTKEFLAQILAEKFQVNKTRKNINTDIGVAQTIIKYLRPSDQIFVVEMGAYKKGEIKAICDLVRPQIGIVTGLNEQHLSLFGTIENTAAAKYELIESLPVKGLAVFNGDNKYCVEMAEKTTGKKVVQYSLEATNDLWADEVVVWPDGLAFKVHYQEQSYDFSAPVLGKYNVRNILAAVAVALELGMPMEEIKIGVSKLVSPERTMIPVAGKYGAQLIDDSYNANPDGVIAAIEYLKTQEDKKKILVITHLLELGEQTINAHKKIGKKAGQVCDYIYIISSDFSELLVEAALAGGAAAENIIVNTDFTKVVEDIERKISAEAVVLFEGRGTEKILNQLRQS